MRSVEVENDNSAGVEAGLLYAADVAARRLQVRESTLRTWAREGKVPHRRLGRALRFSEADLRAIVDASARTPAVAVAVVAAPVPIPRVVRKRGMRHQS